MTKLIFKYSTIHSNVIPGLLNASDHLKKALNEFDSMQIPSSFSYNSYLNDCKMSVSKSINTLMDLQELLQESNNAITNTFDVMKQSASFVDDPVIKIKSNIIKE